MVHQLQTVPASVMVLIDLGTIALTIYLAVTGHWVAFVVMLFIGAIIVSVIADIASGILIAPFLLVEAWMARRASR